MPQIKGLKWFNVQNLRKSVQSVAKKTFDIITERRVRMPQIKGLKWFNIQNPRKSVQSVAKKIFWYYYRELGCHRLKD